MMVTTKQIVGSMRANYGAIVYDLSDNAQRRYVWDGAHARSVAGDSEAYTIDTLNGRFLLGDGWEPFDGDHA